MTKLENLAPPPRKVPLLAMLSNLFSGNDQQIGWVGFAIGMLFFFPFNSHEAFEHLRHDLSFWGDTEHTQGVAVSVEETGEDNGHYRYDFKFELEGQSYEGHCFFSGLQFPIGSQVDVVYPAGNPFQAKLKGSRTVEYPLWVTLLLVFLPALGLPYILRGLRANMKQVKLLKQGRVAYGTLVSAEPTKFAVQEQTVYEYTFKFKPPNSNREHLATMRTHQGSKIEDEEQEAILYLPSFPDGGLAFDSLSTPLEVDGQGQLACTSPSAAALNLIFPSIGILRALYCLSCFVGVFF